MKDEHAKRLNEQACCDLCAGRAEGRRGLAGAAAGEPRPLAEIVASVRGRSVNVREAVLGDVRTLVELMAEFHTEAGYVLDRAHADAAFTMLLSDPRLGRIWLFEQAGAAVGYVVITFVYGRSMAGSWRSSTTSSSARRTVIPVSVLRPWQPRVMRVRFSACAPWRSRSPATTPPRLPYTGAPALR
jgi:hypothetical protein